MPVSGGTHTSGFYGKALAEDLGLLLELASDALRRPTFPQDQVDRLQGERDEMLLKLMDLEGAHDRRFVGVR